MMKKKTNPDSSLAALLLLLFAPFLLLQKLVQTLGDSLEDKLVRLLLLLLLLLLHHHLNCSVKVGSDARAVQRPSLVSLCDPHLEASMPTTVLHHRCCSP